MKIKEILKRRYLNLLDKYEAKSTHNQLSVIWHKAKDYYIWDITNKKYIDFTSGICVTNLGHSNTIKALKKFLNKNLIYTYNYPNIYKIQLLKQLTKLTNFEKTVLFNTGAEAVEAACKIIKSYWQKKNQNKKILISFIHSMHGKTALTENLSSKDKLFKVRDIYTFFPVYEDYEEDITHDIKIINIVDFIMKFANKIAGIIIESYQGYSARFYNKVFIQKLVELCKMNNILVCFDEIQGGFGRTGKLFAYQHYEVEPDLIVVGKAIANGLPLSAVLGSKELLDSADELSSTFAGNVLSCISALEVLKHVNKLTKEAKNKEKILYENLKELNYPIYCKGLLAAIITNTVEEADKIVFKALNKGLLLIWTHRNSVKIAPPLNISEKVLLEGLKILKEVVK